MIWLIIDKVILVVFGVNLSLDDDLLLSIIRNGEFITKEKYQCLWSRLHFAVGDESAQVTYALLMWVLSARLWLRLKL